MSSAGFLHQEWAQKSYQNQNHAQNNHPSYVLTEAVFGMVFVLITQAGLHELLFKIPHASVWLPVCTLVSLLEL